VFQRSQVQHNRAGSSVSERQGGSKPCESGQAVDTQNQGVIEVTNRLFIGGDCDGQMIEVTGLPPNVQIPVRTRVNWMVEAVESVHVESVQSYRRVTFSESNVDLHVYMLGDVARPLTFLLQAYAEKADKLRDYRSET
jgi:hypothetical protein